MASWGDYIRQETLAEEIAAGTQEGFSEEHTIDGLEVRLSVRKV